MSECKKFFTAEVFCFRDLEQSKREHKSISGGRATHQFFKLVDIKRDTLIEAMAEVKRIYGEHYDYNEGMMYIDVDARQWDDKDCPEHLQVRFYETIKLFWTGNGAFTCRKCGCESVHNGKQQDETICLTCEMEGENNDRN